MRLGHLVWITTALTGCATDGSQDIEGSAGREVTAAERAAPAACDRLAATLQADVDANHRDGVVGVLAQVRDDNVIINARAGEVRLGTGIPVAFDSRFRMGSNTKTFVSVVVLRNLI